MLFLILLALVAVWLLPGRPKTKGRNPIGSFDLFCSPRDDSAANIECEPLWECDRIFSRMLSVIGQARRSVRLRMYIIDDDGLGRCFERVLADCAVRGVEVRVACDGYGCRWSRLTLLRRLQKAGVEVQISGGWSDCRNHRKMLIVDDKLAFVGGANIARRYVQGWQDMAVEIRDDGVKPIVTLFDSEWRGGTSPIFRQGRVSLLTEQMLLPMYVQLMQRARRRILIVTPYFVPPTELLDVLNQAVRRGVDVGVLLPARSDVRMVQWASESYVEGLLAEGVGVWLYGERFNHAKCIVVDDVAIVGSANFDYRSLCRNLELMVAFADATFAQKCADEFTQMARKSYCPTLDEWQQRPLKHTLFEKITTPLHPLL